MKVYLAAVSSDTQYVSSLITLFELKRREGDELFIEHRTRGDVARESLLAEFLRRKEFDAILCLDADQRHPSDMLERLRTSMEEHDLDAVCAHYYRRDLGVIHSLCYSVGDGTYPFLPLLDVPREGLHEIAVTGLGCVLIHRRMVEGVQAILPEGQSPFAIGTMPEIGQDWQNWGSDFRFFILARSLGFKLWLDASIESLHGVTLWLGHKVAAKLMDYTKWADGSHDLWEERIKLHGMNLEAIKQRALLLEARRRGLFQQAEPLKGKEDKIPELQGITVAIYEMDGRLKELNAWAEVMLKYPAITKPEDLPTTETWEKEDHSDEGTTEDEIRQARAELHKEQAAEIVNELPTLRGDGRR